MRIIDQPLVFLRNKNKQKKSAFASKRLTTKSPFYLFYARDLYCFYKKSKGDKNLHDLSKLLDIFCKMTNNLILNDQKLD